MPCRRVGSQSHINIPTVNSSANLAATQQQQQQQLQHQLQQQQEQPYQQYQQYQQQHTGATPGHSRSTSDGGLAGLSVPISGSRTGSGNLLSLLKQQPQHQSPGGGVQVVAAPVAPSVPRAEMTLLPPVMQQRWVVRLLGWELSHFCTVIR